MSLQARHRGVGLQLGTRVENTDGKLRLAE
jgi:hypothetical protein